MISQDELNQVDVGRGYFIGEMKKQHKHFTYLRQGALVTLFDGLDVALDTVLTKMPEPKRSEASSKQEPGSFNRFNSYEEALDTFRNKPERVVKFDPAELRIKDESEAGNTVEYDVVGDFIDMGRYMEGVPESVGTMRRGSARNRRANIVINLCQIWSIGHETITHRSERILRLIDGLEAGGIRCQITGIESTECTHLEVIIKHHNEPLTISDLAVVTHPEFLRRVIFRINEHSKTWDYGYGSAVDFSDKLTTDVIDNDINDEIDIVIDSNLRSKEKIDELFDKLERLLVWEMSKPVPEVTSIKIGMDGIFFSPNGYRDNNEIRREGLEAINAS